MAKKLFLSLVIVVVIFAVNSPLFAADAPKSVPKLKIEKLFPSDVSLKALFDASVAVLTEKGLSVHPLKKMKAKLKEKKGKGKIKTPVYRYFKIYSAKPVVESHYRDSYVVKLKVIETEKPLPSESMEAPPAAAEGEIVAAPPEAPPVEIIKNVNLSIKRKFEVHDDATRKWGKADPDEHHVGYTVVHLMDAIEKQLAAGENAEKVEQVNLNIDPPITVR